MRLLVAEDDSRIAAFVAKGLRENAYAVDVAADGAAALYQIAINTYDAIILDVMLPVKDGFAVCKELRAGKVTAPIFSNTGQTVTRAHAVGRRGQLWQVEQRAIVGQSLPVEQTGGGEEGNMCGFGQRAAIG